MKLMRKLNEQLLRVQSASDLMVWSAGYIMNMEDETQRDDVKIFCQYHLDLADENNLISWIIYRE